MVRSKLEREIDHKQKLCQGLWNLYRDRKLTDVTIVVDNVEIHCNKNVLAACSAYFRAMFTSNVQEFAQNKVTLYQVSVKAVQSIIEFMYSGFIDVDQENAQEIFMTSNLFELLDLVEVCVEFMGSQLHLDNCLEMCEFAKYHTCDELLVQCKYFILQNFAEVTKMDAFYDLDACALESFLESDELNVKTEDKIFDITINWINKDLDARRKLFPRLFHKVRLPLISDDFLRERISKHDFVQGNPFCLSILDTFLHSNNSNSDIVKAADLCSNFKHRFGMMTKELIICSGGAPDETKRSFTAIDPLNGTNYYGVRQHSQFDLKCRIDYFQLITLHDSDVYFIGGIYHDEYKLSGNENALKDVLKYDHRDQHWVTCQPLHEGRCAFSACAFENLIFVSGGKAIYPKGNPLDSFDVYDSELEYWQPLQPMPLKLYHHASTVCNGGVYIFGGKDTLGEISNIILRYVQIFNSSTNSWRYGSDFPDERKISAVTRLGNKIFVCGGVRQLFRRNKPMRTVQCKEVFSYDVITDSWWKEQAKVLNGFPSVCTAASVNTKFLKHEDP